MTMYESRSLLLSCGFQGCQICQPSPAESHSAERLTGLQLVFLEQITFRYKGGGLHFCGHIYVSTLLSFLLFESQCCDEAQAGLEFAIQAAIKLVIPTKSSFREL